MDSAGAAETPITPISPEEAEDEGDEEAAEPEETHWPPIARIGLLAMLVLAVAAVVWAGQGGISQAGLSFANGSTTLPAAFSNRGLRVGSTAPNFGLKGLDGGVTHLADLRNETVVVNFWATWCPPCRAEMPALNEVANDYKDKHVVVLGVDEQESAELITSFAGELNLGPTLAIRPLIDADGSASALYHVEALPSTFFIGPDGTVRAINVGGMNRDTILQHLNEAR